VHYPLRGGEQYNVVVTFHSRHAEQWGVREGSREEVQSYFEGICPRARRLIELPRDWKRWATADREPIAQWSFGRVTMLGDAAHPDLAVPGARCLHGDGRRRDSGRGAACARQRLG
jgi:salicylate hydroxylase